MRGKTCLLPSCWILLLVCTLHTWAAETAKRPNVLVVLADQWRWEAFGYAGNRDVSTPNLDRLAAQGVSVTHAVSGMPVCSPMRASFLTGQRPLTHGVFLNDVPLSRKAPTVGTVFRDHGYQTGYIGKWHVDGNGRSAFTPADRRHGFEFWRALECTHNYSNSFYYADSPERKTWPGYDAFAQTSEACDFIRSPARSTRPFFLVLAWGPPHDPYFTAPEKYRARYANRNVALRPNVPAGLSEQVTKILRGYYAHCEALDDCMGELLDALDSSGLATNTVVLFSADHGDMIGSQGLMKKQKPFDESIRVPMLVRWPQGLPRPGTSVNALMGSEDIMPTLLGLCKIPAPATVEGMDFSACLAGGKMPGDGAAVIQCVAPFGEWERRVGGREYRGIRTLTHTYVRDLSGPWLLFDNVADPYQTNNLAGATAAADLQKQLDQQLNRKLAARKDEFMPAKHYIEKWGWRVNTNGTVAYTP